MKPRAFLSTIALIAITGSVSAAPPVAKGAPAGYESVWVQIIQAEKNEEYEKALDLLNTIPAAKATVYSRLKKSALLVRLGKFGEAESILSELAKDPAADSIRATVQGDLDDLHARFPHLTVRFQGSPKDLWVTVDGEHIGPPVTIPLNPGTHVVVATREGKEVFRQNITLQDSQTLDVEIDTSLAPPAPPVANVSVPPAPPKEPPPVRAPDRTTPSSAPTLTPVWVTGGVGVLGLGVGAVFAIRAHQSQSDANSLAAGGNPDALTRYDDTKRSVTVARIGFAVGLVGVGLSTYFLVTSKKEEAPKRSASVRVDAVAAPGFGAVTFGGAW